MPALPRQQQPYPAQGLAAKSSQDWLQRAPRLSVSIPTGRERVQDCSMASPETRAWLLLMGCSQDQFLQARLEPRRNLCNCWMAAMGSEGGQMHLKILEFLTQGHGLLKRLGTCQCWTSSSRAVTCGRGRFWSGRCLWEETGIKIQTLLTAASP